MARDAELDRLKSAQDAQFQRKQSAYDDMQRNWGFRKAAGDALNRAHEAKQRAYEHQNALWQECQRVRSQNGPRIDALNAQQERAYQNMKSAFDDASSAHDRRDGEAARRYADQGHGYKAESQGYVNERRGLVEEIRSARTRHESAKPAFQRAKEEFSTAKRAFDVAKADHERAQTVFKRAKADFDQAAKAFKARLEVIRAERSLHREKDRRLAERAGVPYQYLGSVKVRYSPDGGVNFFFGGVGEADGPGHGHIATDPSGKVTYRRDPFDPHGAHNFTDDPRWQRFDGGFGEACTYRGMNAIRESGVDQQTGRRTIDVYYGGEGGEPLGRGHGHDVYYVDDPDRLVFHRSPRR